MKFVIPALLIIGSFFTKDVYAQDQERIDSLLAVYKNDNVESKTQFKALMGIFENYKYFNQDSAELYLDLAHDLALERNNQKEIAQSWSAKGVLFDILGKKDSSKIYYQKAIAYFESVADANKLSSLRFNLAMIEHGKGNHQKAIDLVNKSILPLQEINKDNAENQAICYGLLCRVYRDLGYFQLALENGLTAIKILENTPYELRYADALRDLANVESYLRNYDKAVAYHKKAIDIFRINKDQYFLSSSLGSLGGEYLAMEEYDQAIPILEESIEIAQEVSYLASEIVSMVHLGEIYTAQEKYELALNKFEQVLNLVIDLEAPSYKAAILRNIGDLMVAWNKKDQALPYYNEALDLAENTQENPLLRDGYFSRSIYYESIGKYRLALMDYKQYHALNDSIFSTQKINAIEEMRIIHDTEQKENEIILLAKNAELDRIKRTRLWGILGGVIIFSLLLFWAQWQRRKKAKEIATQKRKVVELENQQLKTELEFKRQELASKVLQLCRKSEFLQSLNNDVSDLKVNAEGFDKQQLEQLSRKIDQDMNTDAFWDDFLKSFEEVHPNFKKNLLERHPEFAPNEIRLAHLMRMNLDTKDIASLLNITTEGVKKARYRMRKKMGQDSSVNLTEYFVRFENVFERSYT